jgi:hypothetical protein
MSVLITINISGWKVFLPKLSPLIDQCYLALLISAIKLISHLLTEGTSIPISSSHINILVISQKDS